MWFVQNVKRSSFADQGCNIVKYFLQFKITVFYFNILKDVIYFCDAKLYSVLRLQDIIWLKNLH